MSEMIVNTPLESKIVDDWDFTFVGGVGLPITVDPDAGDVILFHPEVIEVHLSAKPSMNNPKKLLPAEHITIEKRHILTTCRREREVLPLTPEQQFEWQKTLQEIGKVVH